MAAIPTSQDAGFVRLLEELDALAVIDMHANQHWPRSVERLVQCRCNLVGALDAKALGSEGFGILDRIDRTQFYSRGATVFELLLGSNHVVASVNPDHVNQIGFQPHRGFQFVSRKQETAIPRDREHLFLWTNDRRRNGPR